MSPRSAYTLRARPDAAGFRQAWDITLDVALNVLADAMIGRAIHGVATPIFYEGERAGERRRYDERLGMFLLRTRQPERYGPGRDRLIVTREHPDGAAALMTEAIGRVASDGQADLASKPRPVHDPLRTQAFADDPRVARMREEAEDRRRAAAQRRSMAAWRATVRSYGEEMADDKDGDAAGDYSGHAP